MANLDDLRRQIDDLSSEYGARFAGHSRVTRSIDEIESLVARTREVVSGLQAVQVSDAQVEALKIAKENLEIYENERRAIADAKAGGAHLEQFSHLATQANFVFARYVRNFAGKSRNTRDLGLLAEMIDDLKKLETRMKQILSNGGDSKLQEDVDLVVSNTKLYLAERGEIVDARASGTPDQQADVFAEVANAQFKIYTDHFANKARITRRPALLQRMIDNLKQIKDRMIGLKTGGLKSDNNVRNIEIVESNVQLYTTELAAVRKERAAVKLGDLMGALGGAANEVMAEYREHFAGKDRKGRDLDRMNKLCDQLGEIARQMADLGRAEVNDMNVKNLGIVTDTLVMYENEYKAIHEANPES